MKRIPLVLWTQVMVTCAATCAGQLSLPAQGAAPGGPGGNPGWLPANKTGFGTSYTTASNVWFTLQGGRLSEVYYPRLDTPSVRNLDFVVTDGQSFAVRAQDASTSTRVVNPESLTYQIVNTDTANRWRLTTTYVTDPSRPTLLIDVEFTSLNGQPYQLYAVYQPQLNNPPLNAPLSESGVTQGDALLAADAQMRVASALVASPAFTAISNGYLGTSDGWTDLSQHYGLTAQYGSAPDGTVVQTGRLPLTGLPGSRHVTLALGFAAAESAALNTANASLGAGFDQVAQAYARGWDQYLDSLRPAPPGLFTTNQRQLYAVSAMVIAASEDKTYRGAFIASPTMPWAFGTGLDSPSDAYHLVWSRDLYEMVTALIDDGDLAAAGRALDFLFNVQQKADGSFPQNSKVDGTPVWGGLQLDEVGDPIILAYQLGRTDATTWSHVKRAADSWQAQLEKWMVTTNGPYSRFPYYLRLTKDGNPNAGTTYGLGDSGPSSIDQRKVVDAGFLELVRLGIRPAYNSIILNSLRIVDAQLGTTTPNGTFWHRYNFDGYGETATGAPWGVNPPDTFITHGRLWPIFAGERGEYDLAAYNLFGAEGHLIAMGRTANEGDLLPEQVWDNQPPSSQPRFAPGTGTASATPLAWTHAQFIRLAWDITAARVLEQPAIVAERYLYRRPW